MTNKLFKKKFQVNTSIRYLVDVEIEKGKEDLFHSKWKRTFPKVDDCLSETRKKAFVAYFRRFYKEGDDTNWIKRLSIRHISKKVGYGVFAKEDIPRYSVIGHYVGVIRLDQEIDPDYNSTFSFGEFPLFSIDAHTASNWGRFMNHSETGDVKTNVVAWEYYTKEGPYIVFTAGPRGIKKGEQLLYSYGDQYWHDNYYTTF